MPRGSRVFAVEVPASQIPTHIKILRVTGEVIIPLTSCICAGYQIVYECSPSSALSSLLLGLMGEFVVKHIADTEEFLFVHDIIHAAQQQ